MAFLKGLFVILLLTIFGYAKAQEALSKDSVLPDSSNFVTASLIAISPGSEIYSVFGHCALRMECPSEGLDVCFSLEVEPSALSFLLGKENTKFVSVETEEYLSHFREEGRSISQCILNLSVSEKQELGKLFYYELENQTIRRFNLKTNDCLSALMLRIESVMKNEQMEFRQIPSIMNQNNGDVVRYFSEKNPWSEFLIMTFAGNEADGHYDVDYKLSPEIMPSMLQYALIRNLNSGKVRPAMIGNPIILHEKSCEVNKSIISPLAVFLGVLLLVIVITFFEIFAGWKLLPRITDALLFFFQTIVGLILIRTTFFSGIFDSLWNWYLIPFNIIPFVVWICFRKKKNFGKIYILYAAVLAVFVLMTPFISQLDWTHQLISLTFLTRCINKYVEFKTSYNEK